MFRLGFGRALLFAGWVTLAFAGAAEGTDPMKENENLKQKLEKATFAGGCFWCMQPVFDKFPGVVSTTVGYAGGDKENPTYEQVSTGRTGHTEAIEVIYDPAKASYGKLADAFFQSIDPTDRGGQFADRGSQYRTAVFYHDENQKREAEASKERLAKSGKFDQPVVTEIVPASKFYPAEEYHQKYYVKNAGHYYLYKVGSGREGFLKKIWKDKK